MIVVDSSVWIARLRNIATAQTEKFDALSDMNVILLGDIILMEVLQGTQNDQHAANVRKRLEKFGVITIFSPDLAVKAARNYRLLRARGKTLSKTADLIIGTYCIEHGHSLLHADKDFLPMAEHLGLQIA
ncbi:MULTISPECIES: PIN domain nuclease [Rhizobium/Agrobacterium group]|jgi:predicted nucleic acid-binding protein|uniref:PIN domain nuclease n=2 Tax=Neorhizobium TaxID=1525371 RepID=A0ABV0M085_9HYPH|nr:MULTISPECIES: PIN domain nuclease [Rhizobium/Agrobacterium group]KGD85759.1 DNA-binding protein [Rhizobium sp. YS-1r]MCC2609104.1 PIN domain nuclease [Neorhizobium petrolearium]WGI69335.1 PIN domain nuclease [Neorhizobium petrolearium]